jgi:hypothetical protein
MLAKLNSLRVSWVLRPVLMFMVDWAKATGDAGRLMKVRAQFHFCTMLGFAFLLLIAPTFSVRAQEPCDYPCPDAKGESRAQQEAEQMVSLSAEKIISILQQEPALLLEVKKLLVRRAFEEGRVIESKELADDAVFRVIAVEESVRVLITQEIEDRGYIQLRPSRRQTQQRERAQTTNTVVEDENHPPRARGADGIDNTTRPAPGQVPAPIEPQPPVPQNVDPRRLLERAGATRPRILEIPGRLTGESTLLRYLRSSSGSAACLTTFVAMMGSAAATAF